ncbi:MAG: FAD binding domain-containing protein [Desulfitobacteriaceae bacterium]
MMLPQFELFITKSLTETSEILLQFNEKARIYAGGTDVLVQMSKGQSHPEALIDIKGLSELYGIDYSAANGLTIGALTTHHELEKSELIQEKYPALHDGVSRVGSVQTRNRGTIGGNLCSALPSADSAGPLLALGAKVRVFGPKGERDLPLEKFFVGTKITVLEPGKILTQIMIPPLRPINAQAYLKFSRRKAMDLALLGVSVYFELDERGIACDRARIALTTAAPTPIRAYQTEEFLSGRTLTKDNLKEAGSLAVAEAKPRDSWRSGAEYRRHLIRVLVPRAAKLALARLEK